jgi:hypothetical protein
MSNATLLAESSRSTRLREENRQRPYNLSRLLNEQSHSQNGECYMLRITTIILLAASCVGCSSSYRYIPPTVVGGHLNSAMGVALSTPPDAQFENAVYNRSGAMTADAVRSAFAQHSGNVDIVTNCQGLDCLGRIDVAKFGYYVQPEILHWEDRATEWSGKSDRLEIRLTVYDTASRKQLARGTFSGKSKWATFGGDHPQDMLAKPTDKFVADLYQLAK